MPEQTNLEFARSYNPANDLSRYDWVIRYAEEKVSLLVKSLEAMDSKTETLMRYLGGAAVGLVALLPIFFKDNLDLSWLLVPSVLALLCGTMKAGNSSAPQDFSSSPTIDQAFRFADAYDDLATVRFHAFWVPLEENLKALMEKKGAAYHVALRCLWIAIWWAVAVAFGIALMGTENIRLTAGIIKSFF